MSARVTVRPSMTKPPDIIRLWTMNSSTNVRSAGPGHATKPSPPRKRRRASRFTRACRSWSFCTKSTSWPSSLRTLTSLNAVEVITPGSPSMRERVGSTSGRTAWMMRPATAVLTLGRFWWMSTGLPKVITDATPAEPRYAAAW